MGRYQPGEFIKALFKDEQTGEAEGMWVKVDTSDDQKRIVFGTLDNEPIVVFRDKLQVGKDVAVSYDLILDHMKG